MGLSSIFIYGLAIVHLYIQSHGIVIKFRFNFGVKHYYLTNIFSIFRLVSCLNHILYGYLLPLPQVPYWVHNAMEDQALHLEVMPL